MKLQSSITQYKKGTQEPESDLIITVDFDPKSKEVEGIMYVHSYCHKTRALTDVTTIIHECFWKSLNQVIDEIEWVDIFFAKETRKQITTQLNYIKMKPEIQTVSMPFQYAGCSCAIIEQCNYRSSNVIHFYAWQSTDGMLPYPSEHTVAIFKVKPKTIS